MSNGPYDISELLKCVEQCGNNKRARAQLQTMFALLNRVFILVNSAKAPSYETEREWVREQTALIAAMSIIEMQLLKFLGG